MSRHQSTVSPGNLLAVLLTQHEALRALMDHCERLADELDDGDGDPAELTREIAKLRLAFDAHNRFEEQYLRPVLREIDAFSSVRIDRMIADHVSEHRAVRDQLGDGPIAVLRAAIDNLRVHLQAEERYFLSAKLLRERLVPMEHGS
jgi:iron-sulfur cluster repair protein YtfE (RIC family)